MARPIRYGYMCERGCVLFIIVAALIELGYSLGSVAEFLIAWIPRLTIIIMK